MECGRCTEHCPAANTGKLLNPKEIVLGLRTYLNELGPASEAPLLGKYNAQEAVFQCTTCGACEFQCPVGIEHLPILVGLRRGAVNTGAWEDDYGSKLFLALERGSNALGLSATERDKFIEKQALPLFDGTQDYCLWLGCMGGYDPKGREIVAAFARVMNYLGTSYGVLRKEKCTGDPVRRLGNDLLFQQLAEANLEALAQNKVKKIVSICPHCVRTIQEDWKEYGTPPEIEHHSEFLARFADRLPSQPGGHPSEGGGGFNPRTMATTNEGALASGSAVVGPGAVAVGPGFSPDINPAESEGALASEVRFSSASPAPAPSHSVPEKIVFHDPCYLGRYRNVYEEPRAVVALAGELVEAPRSHERSFCCGAGGGLAFLGEETGQRVSQVRAAELAATGATTVGTACPFCNSMFRDALAETGEGAPQLMDIAQLAARGLPRAIPGRTEQVEIYGFPPLRQKEATKMGHGTFVEGWSMKIIVAIKQVPERDAPLRIDTAAKWIEESDIQYALNESDAYALEEALQLKEKHGGEVVVLSAGPERVGSTIREALAKGADRAIHIDCADLGARDALGVARLLAAAVKPENPDLVLTGLQSDDLGFGQTGVILAELLGLPHATLILQVEKTGTGIKVKRELEEGWFQSIELPTPAVLTIQSGGNKLRYATLMGIKRAKTKEVRRVTAAELAVDSVPVVKLERVALPQKQKSTQMLPGTAKEAAAALVEKLKFEARVL